MQSIPGYIHSMADFFVTGTGIMGTETTIGGFGEYDPDEAPEFYWVRKAMQYADDLDEFVKMMEKKNNGGYANSWLLADANTGEIVRLEPGLEYSSAERKKTATSSASMPRRTPGFATWSAATQATLTSRCLQVRVGYASPSS